MTGKITLALRRAGGAVSVVLGVVAVGVLVLAIVSPDSIVIGDAGGVLGLFALEMVRLVAAGLVGLVLLGAVSTSRVIPGLPAGPVEPLVAQRPEEIHGRATKRAGEPLDDLFEAYLEQSDADAVASFESRLRETAVSLYAVTASCSREDATAAIDTGTWTEDHRAAAFVAAGAVPLPLRIRIWDVLRPGHPLQHRVQHTVAALEALAAAGDMEVPQ